MPVIEQIREALRASDRKASELAEAAGIHPVNLAQFKAGTRNLPLPSLERLAAALGLEIIAKKIRRQ